MRSFIMSLLFNGAPIPMSSWVDELVVIGSPGDRPKNWHAQGFMRLKFGDYIQMGLGSQPLPAPEVANMTVSLYSLIAGPA